MGAGPEGREVAPPPLLPDSGCQERLPWLVQGITLRGGPGEPFDAGLFTGAPAAEVLGRWERVRDTLGMGALVHARQPHGSTTRLHADVPPGILIAPDADGHATRQPGLLLTISVADCVPVFLVDPGTRAVALLHAGWRGIASGILEAGVRVLVDRLGSDPSGLLLHLGPSICGACYEVGPEVQAAVESGRPGPAPSGFLSAAARPEPTGPGPVDLRRELARRGTLLGLDPHHITRSAACTRCGPDRFFSHRRGDRGRHLAFLGIRS